jgi:hypothetical protein
MSDTTPMLPDPPECGSPCETCEALAHENGRLRLSLTLAEARNRRLEREREMLRSAVGPRWQGIAVRSASEDFTA